MLTEREKLIDRAVRLGFDRYWGSLAKGQLALSNFIGWVGLPEKYAISDAWRHLAKPRHPNGRFAKRAA